MSVLVQNQGKPYGFSNGEKIVSIHQPNFLPWGGYFDKIANSDIHIIMDDVQFSKGGYTNRAKFFQGINGKEPFVQTVPVKQEMGQLIKDVRLHNFDHFRAKFIRTMKMHYPNAYEVIKDVVDRDYWYLYDFNVCITETILDALGCKTEIIRGTTLQAQGNKSEKVLNLVKKVGGTVYVTGTGGKKYLDIDSFEREGIKVEFVRYQDKWADVSFVDFMERYYDAHIKGFKDTRISTSHR